ncbi:hypothetical protein OH76DRAFT_1061861 [Lentinus brumalis]|uniref:Uncharacterized protein n=1 Tax=Lentinus brumalis TaxID=2498619 RepID=A0A371DNK5_9APHY|nr:hypothetical protein OH76DRAFT_1061861 [Polyporus brumalis]
MRRGRRTERWGELGITSRPAQTLRKAGLSVNILNTFVSLWLLRLVGRRSNAWNSPLDIPHLYASRATFSRYHSLGWPTAMCFATHDRALHDQSSHFHMSSCNNSYPNSRLMRPVRRLRVSRRTSTGPRTAGAWSDLIAVARRPDFTLPPHSDSSREAPIIVRTKFLRRMKRYV